MKLGTKLDAKTVAGLELPKGKNDEVFWDGELDGFGIRLRRRGDEVTRSWIAQYRAGGRTRRPTLSQVEKLLPNEARSAARKLLAGVALGTDPQANREAKRREEAKRLRAVADLYLAAYERENRPTSVRIARLYLTGTYFKLLHAAPISSITHGDVAACVRKIENEHSSFTAGAARRAISALFTWAICEGLMPPPNPVAGTRQPTDPAPRDRVLTKHELAQIWNATGGDSDADRVVRLMLLTAARRGEIGGMQWSEFGEDGMWVLPGSRSKNGRSLNLPLPATALSIIRSVPRRIDNDCLFGHAGFSDWSSMKRALDERLGETVKPWRLHDLRRSAVTHMAEHLAVAPHIIERILNHQSGSKVARTYNRASHDREVAAALERWAGYLLALAEGHEDSGNVVHFTRV